MPFDQLKIYSVKYRDERTNDANILVLTMAGFFPNIPFNEDKT